MAERAFAPFHCHAAEHEGILGVIREVQGHVQAGRHEVCRVLVRELAPWFANHVATMDALLAQVLRREEDAAMPGGCAGTHAAPSPRT